VSPLAAGARRATDEEDAGVGTRPRTVVEERLVLDALRFRDAVLFRAVLFREPEARLRAAPPALRAPAAVRLRPPAALRFRLAGTRARLRRLAAAARLVFFLPGGGIVLLRELGSPSATGEANPLPASVMRKATKTPGHKASTFNDVSMRDHHRVTIRVVVGRLRPTRVDASVNLAHHPEVPRRVYARWCEVP
jgi:hypothetical protein